MDYKFKTLEFEGPLDLLLHLIKKDNIDIFNINISDITDQYLKYIKSMKEINLNVDSEYLVMASELTYLKSRELVPSSDDEEEEEDPKLTFINRLAEYKKYKELSQDFKLLEKERGEYFTKCASLLDEYRGSEAKIDSDISLDDLIDAFMKFQEKKESLKPLNTVVTRKEYSVHKRSTYIMKKLRVKGSMKFDDLFEYYDRGYVVVTFLAILNLARNGDLFIKQDNNNDSIVLSVRGGG